ncbi:MULTISPECIES: Mu transposase C-terminal domain-containing protein [Kitasatospora]|uniref:Putative transposase n=1 Tax=Kitasatospora setae (strain ATCC 33774 / DSM 43861 / JCM 3304 / KCC A-0304 / NBRC 14216 / KM-6054) TaxID=452652 RepID=E4NAH1_KITSK|nr:MULTISPECIES: Mu transposase C-terminal domain-containing protein [Kitasatospora]BAJ28202.1 putative transposase [Kitasatospora setae KM-6054]
MSARRIAVGDWISFEDETHRVAGLDGERLRLRSETGRLQTILLAEVLNDLTFRADAEPVRETANEVTLDIHAALEGLPKAVQEAALSLEAHLLEAMTGYRSGDPMKALPGEPKPEYDPELPVVSRVAAKATELGKTDRWVWKWWKRRTEQGLWGLVDQRKAQIRNPLKNTDPRLVQAIREQAAAERLDSTGTIGGRFLRRTQNRLEEQYGAGVVPMPGRDTFRRVVAEILGTGPARPAYQRISSAQQPDRPFGNVIATRPGEVVMLDTTPLDVMAFDPVTSTTMRIELTIALDVATRSILAWRITPEGTKAIDIGLLLADVMTPEPMRPHWPDVLRYQMLTPTADRFLDVDERLQQAAARPVIYPETIVFDHGKPYTSEVVQRACLRWKIDLQDARKLKPTDKPHVERVFGTIRVQFSQHVAGYKGNNIANRGLTVEEQARWTIDEITEFFAEYVVAVYQRAHHSGLNAPGFPTLTVSPNEAYRLGIAAAGYVDVPRDPSMYFELLPIAYRVIHPYGIELNHLVYNADVLYRYRGTKSPYQNGLWPIRFDPRNLLNAYFLDPADGTWHVLRWVHALAEHTPFTDITLREAKRLLTSRGHGTDDQDAVAVALVGLQNRTDAPETWKTDRKRIFRDANRAAAQAADQKRSKPPVDNHPPLTVVPAAPDQDDSTWGDIDLTTIVPAEIYDPTQESR